MFGYALTCHKAQGGEWDYVYLDIPKSVPVMQKPYVYQWIYTAMTPARKELYIAKSKLSEKEEMEIIRIAIQTIEADNRIEYSEISFFKKIRQRLNVSDETILAEFPNKEDYLLPDIKMPEDMTWNVHFENIQLNIKGC